MIKQITHTWRVTAMKNSQTKVLRTEKRGLQRVPCSACTTDHCQGWEHNICLFTQPTLRAGMGFNIQHRYWALATHGDFYSQSRETGTGRGLFIQPAFDNFPDGINLSCKGFFSHSLHETLTSLVLELKYFSAKLLLQNALFIHLFFFMSGIANLQICKKNTGKHRIHVS